MLDLDSLADNRAKSLNQGGADWRAVVWSAEFQKISASMSDGDVENIIAWCPSPQHLKTLVKHLDSKCATSGLAPIAVISAEAERAGVSPSEWIQLQLGDKK